MDDCIFCAIADGRAPARMIGENDGALAFLDISPLTEGHTLVVPRVHSRDVVDAAADDLAAVMALVAEVAPSVLEGVGAPAFHLMANTGAEALQTVFHTHFHVMPRRPGDGFAVDLSGRGASSEALDAVHERIVAAAGR
ncbi:MAG: HIT family protein [Actinomycetota bacterium]